MTRDDISKLEDELQIRLPKAYCEKVVPFIVRAKEGNSDSALWDDAAELVRLNRCYRTGEMGIGKWSPRFFVPGQVLGDPSVYAIDLANETVLWLDHGMLTDDASRGVPLREWLDEQVAVLFEEEDGTDSDPAELNRLMKGHRRADMAFLVGCGAALVAMVLVIVAVILL